MRIVHQGRTRRLPTAPGRYVAATATVAALLVVLLLFLAHSNFLTARGMTAVTLMLTGATAVLLADDRPGRTTWRTPLLAAAAIICATLSYALAPTALLTVSIATTFALWFLQLTNHLTVDPPTLRKGPAPPSRLPGEPGDSDLAPRPSSSTPPALRTSPTHRA